MGEREDPTRVLGNVLAGEAAPLAGREMIVRGREWWGERVLMPSAGRRCWIARLDLLRIRASRAG